MNCQVLTPCMNVSYVVVYEKGALFCFNVLSVL
jgi:hypothetical protein